MNQPTNSQYKMFNPYQHLTQSYFLSPEQWERIKATLTRAELATIESGGVVRLGASSVWKLTNQ